MDREKGLPSGNDDFISIRNNNEYYVDKSKFIIDMMEQRNVKVKQLLRPHGFGKTVNLTMLDAFHNIDYAGQSQRWFEGLEIYENDKIMAKANQDPVIYISLKGTGSEDYNQFLKRFGERVSEAVGRHPYLLDWDTDWIIKEEFVELYEKRADDSALMFSLKTLSDALRRYYDRKVIMIVDDYDDPVNCTFGMESRKRITDFMRCCFSNALKGNESLNYGIISGVMEMPSEFIFDSFNNYWPCTMFSDRFNDDYGFTENEVKDILSHFG